MNLYWMDGCSIIVLIVIVPLGTCRRGVYGVTGLECDVENESVWIDECELMKGITAVRVFQ